MDYINQHRWPPLSYEQAMEEYRKKYLEEESDESAEEDNESEGEEGSERDTGSEVKSGRAQKRKQRTQMKGSVVGQSRTDKAIVAVAMTGRRGRIINNKCKVM